MKDGTCNEFVTPALSPRNGQLRAAARQDHLREWAVHMLALAAETDDRQFAEWLSIRARQYLREAQALEAATPLIVAPDRPEKE